MATVYHTKTSINADRTGFSVQLFRDEAFLFRIRFGPVRPCPPDPDRSGSSSPDLTVPH